MEKQVLWKLQVRTIRPEVFYITLFWKTFVLQNSCKTSVSESFFNKTSGYYARTSFWWNISRRLIRADLLQKNYSKNFPGNTIEESLFQIILQTLYLKLYKNAIWTSMFSYKFWKFFRKTFPLKTLCNYLWMESIYSVKIYLENTS